MNKKALVTLMMAGSIIASPVFASSIFQQLLSGKVTAQPKAASHKKSSVKPHHTNYTDFSGYWSGNCTYNSKDSISMSFDIENNDEYFNINRLHFSIGSLETHSESSRNISVISHSAVRWNSDMSELIINVVSVDQYRDSSPYNEPNPIYTDISEFTVSLENGQLILKGQGLDFSNLHQWNDGLNMVCTLDNKS